jgi:hypothetical protein
MSNNELNIIGSILSEAGNPHSDPFAEFMVNNPTFIANSIPLPSFKPFDNYADLAYFLDAKFNNQTIINVAFSENNFAELEASLKSLGIVAKQDNENKLLKLHANENIRFSNKILKFSGNIQLESNLKIASHLVVFDEAKFYLPINKNYNIELLRKNYDNQNAYHVYVRNTALPNLFLYSIDHYWFAGQVDARKIEFNGLAHPFKQNDECALNIANGAYVRVESEFKLKNANCINDEGQLSANVIDIEANQDSEFFIAKSAIVSAIAEINIKGTGKTRIIQAGTLAAHKLSIRTLGEIHNSGSIVLGISHDKQNHSITADRFFNYIKGNIFAPQEKFYGTGLEISTINSSGNLGSIVIKEIILNSPGGGKINAAFYNNGVLEAIKLSVGNKAYLLNDQKGRITALDAEAELCRDLKNIVKSSSLMNRGGEIKIGRANLEIGSFFTQDGDVQISSIGSSAVFYGIEGGKTFLADFSSNAKPTFYINNPKGKIAVDIATLKANQALNFVIASNGEVLTLNNKALPAVNNMISKINNDISVNADLKDNYIHFNGNFDINGFYIGPNQQLSIGRNIDSNIVGSSLTIDALIMEKDSVLVVNSDGRVFTSKLAIKDAVIKGFGEFKVKDDWRLSGKVTFEGNVAGPKLEITKDIELVLSDSHLVIDGDMFNHAMIRVLGTSVINAKHFSQMGEIAGSGNLNIKSHKFVMGVITETLNKFIGNHHFVDTVVSVQSKVNLDGELFIEAEELAQFEAAQIKAKKIRVVSGDKIIVLPVQLYHKIHQYWNGGCQTNEVWDYVLSNFNGEEGIEIYSKGGTRLIASVFESKTPIKLYTEGSNVVQGISKEARSHYYNSWYSEAWHGFSEARHEVHSYGYDTHPILPSFSSDIHIQSLGDSSFLGLKVKGDSKSTFIIGSESKSVLAQFLPMMEIHIHSYDHKRTNEWFGFLKTGKSYHYHKDHVEIPILNIIESSKGVYGLCYGKWIQIGTEIITSDNDNLIYIKATEEINLFSAYKLEITQDIHESYSISVVGTLSLDEVSVGISAKYTQSSESMFSKIPVQAIYRGNIYLIAPKVHTISANAEGGIFKVEAEKWIDEAAKAEYNYRFKYTEVEAAVKLGLRSSLGKFVNSIGDTVKGLESSTPEGMVNAGFAGYASYLTGVQMLSGGGVSLGAWVNLHVEQTSQNSDVIRVVPSRFNFLDINIKATELDFTASQIYSYNAYIQAEKINFNSGVDKANAEFRTSSVDVDIPLNQGAPAGVNLAHGQGNQSSEQHLHFVLKVTNDLKMHISGKASIKGATISAKNLDASFGELILESVKDIEKHQSMGISLGLSTDQNDHLKSIGGSYSKGLREVVSKVTEIIGTEKIKIVVAHALHLNGAMIANAKTNDDGTYNDLGNLELTVGQLFVRHIHQLDEGVTLGASIEFARNKAAEKDKLGERNNIYKFSFGMKDGEGTVFATLGNGKIVVVDKTLGDDLNRNINKVNTGIDYSIKIETINMHFQGRDEVAEKQAADRLKKGIPEILIEEAKRLYSDLEKMFGFNKPDPIQKTSNNDKTEKTPDEQQQNSGNNDVNEDEDIIDLDKEEQKSKSDSKKESSKDQENVKEKIVLPEHLAKLYNDISSKIDAMPISDSQKESVKTQMRNNLEKANSEDQVKYLRDVFAFISSPMIWLKDKCYSNEDEAIKNSEFQTELGQMRKSYKEETEQQKNEEAKKSPEVKAREELERKTLNDEAIKTNMYLLKKYLKEEDQKKAYIKNAIFDYMIAKSQGALTVEAIGALGVIGVLELPIAAGLTTIYGVATFGDDEMELIDKIKAKGSYKK